MRFSFGDFSIRGKLVLLVVFTTLVALFISATAIVSYDAYALRRLLVLDMATTTNMIALSTEAALAFHDDRAALRALETLRAEPSVVAARIKDAAGQVVAEYGTRPTGGFALQPGSTPSGHLYRDGFLVSWRRITSSSGVLGTVVIQSSLKGLNDHVSVSIRLTFIVAALSCIAATLISTRLQRLVSGPIRSLADLARRIEESGDYTQRAVKQANDETGVLVETFNGMLQQIQERTAALQEANTRLSQISENIEDAFWLGDARDPENYSVLYVNPAFERLWGQTAEEAYANPELWHACIHEDDRARVARSFQAFLSGRAEYNLEYRVVMPDQTVRIVTDSGNLVRENGEIVRAAGITLDITDRRHAEDERNKLQGQLRESQKLEAIGQLAGGVAHDFRNMLSVINNALGPVRDAVALHSDVDLSKHLNRIQRASDQASKVIGSLLAFGGRREPDFKVSLLSEIVLSAADLLRATLPSKVELRVSVHPELDILVRADTTQLTQVVLNLGLNARDAMPDGGILRIDIATNKADTQDGEERPVAVMVIEDTGLGIDEEGMSHIFEPFFTTKAYGEGTGLGLSVVHGIVKSHDGRIEVDSVVGRGTRFSISFPIAKPEQARVNSVDMGEAILVAANEQVGSLLRSSLLEIGLEVQLVIGIEELMSCLNDDVARRLIVVDLDGDGPETVIRLLKRIRSERDLACIFMTARSDEPRELWQQYSDRILRKPFGMSEFSDFVHRTVDIEYQESNDS